MLELQAGAIDLFSRVAQPLPGGPDAAGGIAADRGQRGIDAKFGIAGHAGQLAQPACHAIQVFGRLTDREPFTPALDKNGKPNAVLTALERGYVVAAPGARGKSSKDANGKFSGKAPAAIVDLKAAVRYLKFNDAAMAGDANKIISNGTSTGGAMSALLGVSASVDRKTSCRERV